MPSRTHLITKIADAFRDIDEARARAAASHTSCAVLVPPAPRGTPRPAVASQAAATARVAARQAWRRRYAAGWRA